MDWCADCGSEEATEAVGTHPFQYGAPEPVTLWATHPVWTCGCCGAQWTDHRAEEARDQAVGQYLLRDVMKQYSFAPPGYRTACQHPYDALREAENSILWVEIEGGALQSFELKETLRAFARWCALQVVGLWDCPEFALQYLQTGDESLQAKTYDYAWDAMEEATGLAVQAAGSAAFAALRMRDDSGELAAPHAWRAALQAQQALPIENRLRNKFGQMVEEALKVSTLAP